MPAAAAATAVEGRDEGATRVDTGAVVDNGPLTISEQDDRLYRHITLPNNMQVDILLALLILSYLSATPALHIGRAGQPYPTCKALRRIEHCCCCTQF